MSESGRIRDYFRSTEWRGTVGRAYLMRERTALLRASVADIGIAPARLRICDAGCGGGADLVSWQELGVPASNLAGTELVEERARIALSRLPDADIRLVRGFELPFDTASFDVTTASLVLSTVRNPEDRAHLLHEIARVTRPGGLVLVYDFTVKKPWNPNVVAIRRRWLHSAWRQPDAAVPAAPLLPLLDLLLSLPRGFGHRMIRWLPRTHRLWVWRADRPAVPPAEGSI